METVWYGDGVGNTSENSINSLLRNLNMLVAVSNGMLYNGCKTT